MRLAFTFLALFATIVTYCQIEKPLTPLNLNFEIVEKGGPVGWESFGSSGYVLALDSSHAQNRQYSAYIGSTAESENFKAWAYTLPDNYDGKEITLSGYIKTEDVTEGYAGLWMRIDPSVAFDNMNGRGVTGTTDWTQYAITLTMDPEKTQKIVFGGLLVGKGKMWLDNLNITVDGKDLKDLKPLQRKIFPAEKDREFDEGSKITITSVDESQVKNLKTLGLIWGFLKYYHPNIASGQYNWDYELFRVLPRVLKAGSQASRDDILVKWIEDLGTFPRGKETDLTAEDVKLKPDLEWIENSGFSDELTAQLLKVKNAGRSKEHYYIELHESVGNPSFKNEKPYASMNYPDAGFRLLSLFGYWNKIQYYFPYRNLIEEDWKDVLQEFIPKFINAKDDTEYTLASLELIGRIHDTHANVYGNRALNSYFGSRYAIAELAIVEDKAVVTGFYNKTLGKESGLEVGDIVSTINNRPVEEMVKDRLYHYPASNYPTQLRDLATGLLRTSDSTISVEYIRNGKALQTTLKTFSSKNINVYYKFQATDTCFKKINEDIAYINNGSVKTKDIPKIWNDIKGTKGLIIDLRNYPADFPIYELSNYLMPESTPFVKFTNGSIENPGLFTYTKILEAGKEN